MIDLTKGAKRPYHRIRLSKEAKSDMATWLTFLDKFNGKTFFLEDKWETSPSLELFTDVAGSKGYGAIFGKHWFCGAWPASWTSFNIAFLELFPIVLSLHIWGPLMANKCVAFYTDNAAIVDIINQQTSKHPLVMILVRDLVLTSLTYNILFRARHIPACIILVRTTFHVFRSSSSRNSRPGRTNCQLQFPPTFCQRIGHYAEGFVKFCTVVGHTQTLPESLGSFYSFY